MQDLIPFSEIKVPDNWDYDESVKKMRPQTRQSYAYIRDLKIAREALNSQGLHGSLINKTISGQNVQSRSWGQFCEAIGITQRHANRLIAEFFYERFLYNIWILPRGDEEDYFGHFPYRFMQNLLFYHSEENDLIYDPFAGSGVTIDVCKEMKRHYYCSDLFPQKKEIKQWDVAFGLPDDLPEVDMAFLDPPYWKQAEGKYSDDEHDLGNMNLKDFYKILKSFILELKNKSVLRIVLVISPTQWPNENHVFEHHWPEIHFILKDKYRIEMEYLLPYSTQQYNGNQVLIAKKEKIPLVLTRSMIVWKLQ